MWGCVHLICVAPRRRRPWRRSPTTLLYRGLCPPCSRSQSLPPSLLSSDQRVLLHFCMRGPSFRPFSSVSPYSTPLRLRLSSTSFRRCPKVARCAPKSSTSHVDKTSPCVSLLNCVLSFPRLTQLSRVLQLSKVLVYSCPRSFFPSLPCMLQLSKVLVMDGSSRTSHSNAYFVGLCGEKQIVL